MTLMHSLKPQPAETQSEDVGLEVLQNYKEELLPIDKKK